MKFVTAPASAGVLFLTCVFGTGGVMTKPTQDVTTEFAVAS